MIATAAVAGPRPDQRTSTGHSSSHAATPASAQGQAAARVGGTPSASRARAGSPRIRIHG